MNEQLSAVVSHRAFLPAVVGVVSGSAGFAAGYFFRKRQKPFGDIPEELHEAVFTAIDQETHMIMEQIIEDSGYSAATAEDSPEVKSVKDLEDEETIPEEVKGLLDRLSGKSVESVVIEEEFDPEAEGVIVVPPKRDPSVIGFDPTREDRRINVFEQEEPSVWDHELELQNRTPDHPYIITEEEFLADAMGFEQTTLTYYEGDDVLVDPRDTPIHQPSKIVGELRFGHGSQDPNAVYIRNEKNKGEYEVLRHRGSYQVEILGLSDEPEEASNFDRGVPKFRLKDGD